MLFDTINELKQYVGGGANLSVELDSLEPALQRAKGRLLTYIDAALFDDLVTNQATPDAAQTALLPYVQRPLALLALYEYAHIGGIQFSESGMMRMETETMKSAYKYQETEYKDWMLRAGYQAIEDMLIFLQANANDYPLWDVGKDAHNELLLNTAQLTRQYYSTNLDRWTWEHMRPAIADVEQFAIIDTIGQHQFDDLTLGRSQSDLTAAEQKVIKLLQKATAHLAIDEAVARNYVRLQGGNVVQMEQDKEHNGSASAKIAMPEGVNLKVNRAKSHGNRYLNQARMYLDDNTDAFPLYAAYRAELEEANDALKTSDDDDTSATIERPTHSELYPNWPSDDDNDGKTAIRF